MPKATVPNPTAIPIPVSPETVSFPSPQAVKNIKDIKTILFMLENHDNCQNNSQNTQA
jgi:hypothetical protein